MEAGFSEPVATAVGVVILKLSRLQHAPRARRSNAAIPTLRGVLRLTHLAACRVKSLFISLSVNYYNVELCGLVTQLWGGPERGCSPISGQNRVGGDYLPCGSGRIVGSIRAFEIGCHVSAIPL